MAISTVPILNMWYILKYSEHSSSFGNILTCYTKKKKKRILNGLNWRSAFKGKSEYFYKVAFDVSASGTHYQNYGPLAKDTCVGLCWKKKRVMWLWNSSCKNSIWTTTTKKAVVW